MEKGNQFTMDLRSKMDSLLMSINLINIFVFDIRALERFIKNDLKKISVRNNYGPMEANIVQNEFFKNTLQLAELRLSRTMIVHLNTLTI